MNKLQLHILKQMDLTNMECQMSAAESHTQHDRHSETGKSVECMYIQMIYIKMQGNNSQSS